MNDDFKKQYQSPQWKKRRLEYINNLPEDFKEELFCEHCFSAGDGQVHLHHLRYYGDRKIWEYDDNELILLCNGCHKQIHEHINSVKDTIANFSDNPDRLGELDSILLLLKDKNPYELVQINKIIKIIWGE